LLLCGADFSRVFDATASDLSAYAEHIARIPFSDSDDALPLFFINGRLSSPELLMVLHSRVLERTRAFQRSSWVVCLAPARLSAFIRDAAALADIEPIGNGLCAWHAGPRPMLVTSWGVAAHDLANCLTYVGLVPESGFIASVGPEDESPGFDAEGAVVGLESLERMRAAQQAHQRSGPRGKIALRPNPRLRRNG
jgi:hypothetical protein